MGISPSSLSSELSVPGSDSDSEEGDDEDEPEDADKGEGEPENSAGSNEPRGINLPLPFCNADSGIPDLDEACRYCLRV
jgi:hypothetical protein